MHDFKKLYALFYTPNAIAVTWPIVSECWKKQKAFISRQQTILQSHVTSNDSLRAMDIKTIIVFAVFTGSEVLKEMKKKQVAGSKMLKEMKKKQVLKEMKKKEHPSQKLSAKKKKHFPYPPLKIMHELKKLYVLF